jgi:excinuclease ABC subunit C
MLKDIIKNLPENPGVYLFKHQNEVVYIGKAGNLKRRVKSYFSSKEKRVLKIREKIEDIDFIKTDTVIEALIKEAELIKKYKPILNIKENDDRSFLYVVTTKDVYPRVLLLRGKDVEKEKIRKIFGPFVYALEIREALKIIRKIFPYSTHTEKEVERGVFCFYYQINLCPGNCGKRIDKKEYLKNIRKIELFFEGGKKRIISLLEKEMEKESKLLNFEKADELKRKVNALKFIQDTALIKKKKEEKQNDFRIEGYDISHISGRFTVGAMVVFKNNVPDKKEYRLFKVRTIENQNDTGAIKEILKRRFKNNWDLPNLILIDGGKGQVSAVKEVLNEEGIFIPVIGIAKGKDRKKEEVIGEIPSNVKKEVLLRVQEEAHRFAISYHRKLRKKEFLK